MGTDRHRQAFIYALDDEVGSVTEISERLVVRITFNYDRFGGCVRELQVGLRAVIEGLDELHAKREDSDLKTCGVQNEHLCVRVVPAMGRYGTERDYLVIKGY